MAANTAHAFSGTDSGLRRWERIFLFSVGSLTSTVVLKIASIQYLELLYIVQFAVLLIAFSRAGVRVRIFRPLVVLGGFYVTVAVMALLLALAALRFTFYLAPDQSVLQRPLVITFSRVSELLLDAGMMLYLAGLFRERSDAARFTMRVFFWVGAASVAFSIISYPLDLAHIASLGAYGDLHRFRGFYNEGGPYGLYLITVTAVGWALACKGWEPKRKIYPVLVVMVISLMMTLSKSALAALVLLFLLRSFFARSIAQRVTTIVAGVSLLIIVSQTFDLGAKLRLYQEASSQYEHLSHLHVGDGNFVQGRVAALFIVPRMIAAHPWSGIGWGNYGILRNDPQYRGASAWGEPDETGLGIFGVAAETGIPLLLLLMTCLALPYLWLRRSQAPEYIANMALLQPVAHIFGAQLNLTYPWVVTAFALGLGFSFSRQKQVSLAKKVLTTKVLTTK